jgi:hypothetical protein
VCKFFFRTGLANAKALRKNLIFLCCYASLNTWLEMSISQYQEWLNVVIEMQKGDKVK